MFCWTLRVQQDTPALRGPYVPNKQRCATVVVRHEVYIFGGGCYGSNIPMRVTVFDMWSLRWRMLPLKINVRGDFEGPPDYEGPTVVLIDDLVYLWGGRRGGVCSDTLYTFDVDGTRQWDEPKVSGYPPDGTAYHSACVLGKVMYVHGGYRATMHKLDTATMTWAWINAREAYFTSGHSANFIGTKMFVFGGCLRVFDTETLSWMSLPGSAELLPEQRQGHAAFVHNGELYISGGYNAYRNLNDMWRLNPRTFSWKKVEPKGKKCPPGSLTGCLVGDCVVFFGEVHPCRINTDNLFVLELNPSLKTLCKLTVIQNGLEASGLTHNIKWELGNYGYWGQDLRPSELKDYTYIAGVSNTNTQQAKIDKLAPIKGWSRWLCFNMRALVKRFIS